MSDWLRASATANIFKQTLTMYRLPPPTAPLNQRRAVTVFDSKVMAHWNVTKLSHPPPVLQQWSERVSVNIKHLIKDLKTVTVSKIRGGRSIAIIYLGKNMC